jgi:Uma2 family endonuclease
MALIRTETEQMSEEAFREFSLHDPQGRWELVNGQLREKPSLSAAHGDVLDLLLEQLYAQLDRSKYRIRTQHGRLRVSSETYYIPDIAIIPIAVRQALLTRPRALDAYPEPLPLVIEVWSPSTGNYDINAKLPDYQQRGDREIWYIHPYERTLTAWRRRRDGSYAETIHRSGIVYPASLPGVVIDLDALFEA